MCLCACLNQCHVYVLGAVYMSAVALGLPACGVYEQLHVFGCGGRLSILQCFVSMSRSHEHLASDCVTNDVTLIDTCTQGRSFPFF